MPTLSTTTKSKPAVEVKHLTIDFDGKTVLKHVSFDIEQGTIAAIIGPNGSGKTTLIKAILNLIPITSGSVSILGQPLVHVQKSIGYVPQRFSFDPTFPITAREFLLLAVHAHSNPGALLSDAIKNVELPPYILNKQLGTLSGGQLQRVLIAQATINKPSILILDEPSTGIDIAGEAAFYNVIRHLNQQYGTTILLVSHDISMVSKSVDQVICINHQLTCVGPPKTTLTKEKLADVFGEHAHLIEHDTSHK